MVRRITFSILGSSKIGLNTFYTGDFDLAPALSFSRRRTAAAKSLDLV